TASGPHPTTTSGQWRRRPAARNPATWWTAAVAVLLVTALALFVFRGEGGGGAPNRGHGGPPPDSFLYTVDTGVGTGGVAGSAQPGEDSRGSVPSPGWEGKNTLAFLERTGPNSRIHAATLGNQAKVRAGHPIDRPPGPPQSPAGQGVAFLGQVGEVNQLFVMSRNGQRKRPLTHLPAGLSDPAWSRDAHRIYFAQNVATGGSRLAAIDVKSGKRKFLT